MNEASAPFSDPSPAATPKVRAIAHTPRRLEAYGKRLIRYLSGGGIAAFGRTAKEEAADEKRERFLAAAIALGVAWLVFWIF